MNLIEGQYPFPGELVPVRVQDWDGVHVEVSEVHPPLDRRRQLTDEEGAHGGGDPLARVDSFIAKNIVLFHDMFVVFLHLLLRAR